MTVPISATLPSVPRPGRCRSGTHSSSTAAPTVIAQVPVGMPVCPGQALMEDVPRIHAQPGPARPGPARPAGASSR